MSSEGPPRLAAPRGLGWGRPRSVHLLSSAGPSLFQALLLLPALPPAAPQAPRLRPAAQDCPVPSGCFPVQGLTPGGPQAGHVGDPALMLRGTSEVEQGSQIQPDLQIALCAHQCLAKKWLTLGVCFPSNSQPSPFVWAGEAVGHLGVALLARVAACALGHVHSGSAHQSQAGASRDLSPGGLKLSPRAFGWRSLCLHFGDEEPGTDSGSPSPLEPPQDTGPSRGKPFTWQHPELFSRHSGFQQLTLKRGSFRLAEVSA